MQNNENEQTLEIIKGVATEVAKEAYADLAKPTVKPAGELVGLVPRAIKAALAPFEEWILQREYNIAETKKLLAEKLKDAQPDLIQPPEQHIAIPALQYISYCMDNEELRDMYANLLANSMNRVARNGIHPAYVETIRQLCPDEAKILKYFKTSNVIPTISFCVDVKSGGRKVIIREFSNIPIQVGCERPFDCEEYFDNLARLGLIEHIDDSLTDETQYDALLNDDVIRQMRNNFEKSINKTPNMYDFRFGKHHVQLTPFGKRFCNFCLETKAYINAYENNVEIAFRG